MNSFFCFFSFCKFIVKKKKSNFSAIMSFVSVRKGITHRTHLCDCLLLLFKFIARSNWVISTIIFLVNFNDTIRPKWKIIWTKKKEKKICFARMICRFIDPSTWIARFHYSSARLDLQSTRVENILWAQTIK